MDSLLTPKLVILRDADFFEKHEEVNSVFKAEIYASFLDENNQKVKRNAIDNKKRYRVFFDDYENDITYQLGTDDTDSGDIESDYYDLDFLALLIENHNTTSIFHVIIS